MGVIQGRCLVNLNRRAFVLFLSMAACRSATNSPAGSSTMVDASDGTEGDSGRDGADDVIGDPTNDEVIDDRTIDGTDEGLDDVGGHPIDVIDETTDSALTDTTDAGPSECVLSGGQCVPAGQTPQCVGIVVCPTGTTNSNLQCDEPSASCCVPAPPVDGPCADAGGQCFLTEGSCRLNCARLVPNDCGPPVGNLPRPVCCVLPPCLPAPPRICFLDRRCGRISNGCGGIIDCGSCPGGGECLDGGVCGPS
jgi:hypothetical protein